VCSALERLRRLAKQSDGARPCVFSSLFEQRPETEKREEIVGLGVLRSLSSLASRQDDKIKERIVM
jgi:hypothetical protein